MTVIRELVTVFGFKVKTGDLIKFERTVEQITAKLENMTKQVAAAGASIAAAAGGLTALSLSVAKSSIAQDQLAQKIGVSVQELQELGLAAENTGISAGSLEKSFEHLSNQVGTAANAANSATTDFDKIGVSLKDNNGKLKSTSSLYAEVAIAIESIEEPAAKAQLAYKLLGSSNIELTKFMSQSSDALAAQREEVRKLSYVTGKAGVKSAQDFMKAWNGFKIILDGVKKQIADRFMPVITNVINRFKDWYLVNKDLVSSGIEHFISTVASSMKILATVIEGVTFVARKVIDFFGGFGNASRILGTALAFSLIPRIISTTTELAALGEVLALSPVTKLVGKFALLGAAIGLIVDDLYHWQAGNESVIGMILGDFEKFKTKCIEKFDAVKEAITKFTDLFGGTENTVKAFSLVIGSFLIPSLVGATRAFFGLTAAMLTNPFVLATAAVAAIGTAIYVVGRKLYKWLDDNFAVSEKLSKTWKGFKDVMSNLWDAIKDNFVSVFKFIGTYSAEIFDGIVGAIGDALSAVTGFFSKVKPDDIEQVVKLSKEEDDFFNKKGKYSAEYSLNNAVSLPLDKSLIEQEGLSPSIRQLVAEDPLGDAPPSSRALAFDPQINPISLANLPAFDNQMTAPITNNRTNIVNNNSMPAANISINITANAGTNEQQMREITTKTADMLDAQLQAYFIQGSDALGDR